MRPDLSKIRGFVDLNIPVESSDDSFRGLVVDGLVERVGRAFRLGFHAVAVNVVCRQNKSASGNKQKRKMSNMSSTATDFPTPPDVQKLMEDVCKFYPQAKNHCKILTRLTILFDDNDIVPTVKRSDVVNYSYDLIAIQPPSTDAIVSLLKTDFTADIVTFVHASSHRDVRWNRKLYRECVRRGMAFELQYGAAIDIGPDGTKSCGLVDVVSQANEYLVACGGKRLKSVFVSSGALLVHQLRSPTDVMYLAYLFSHTSEADCRQLVSAGPVGVLHSAASRSIGPYRITITKLEKVGDTGDMSVPSSKVVKLTNGVSSDAS